MTEQEQAKMDVIRRRLAGLEGEVVLPKVKVGVIVKVPKKLLRFVDEAARELFTLSGSFPTADAVSESQGDS